MTPDVVDHMTLEDFAYFTAVVDDVRAKDKNPDKPRPGEVRVEM